MKSRRRVNFTVMPVPSILPESPRHLIEQWHDGAVPLHVMLTDNETKFQMNVATISRITERNFAVSSNGCTLWLSWDGAQFGMLYHNPTALAELGEGFDAKFVRVQCSPDS